MIVGASFVSDTITSHQTQMALNLTFDKYVTRQKVLQASKKNATKNKRPSVFTEVPIKRPLRTSHDSVPTKAMLKEKVVKQEPSSTKKKIKSESSEESEEEVDLNKTPTDSWSDTKSEPTEHYIDMNIEDLRTLMESRDLRVYLEGQRANGGEYRGRGGRTA